MSALSRATAGLASTLKSVAGESAVYSRAPSTSVTLTAVHDLQAYEVINDEGFPELVMSRDFLITATDLSGTLTPRPGDRITVSLAGTSTTFEVMPLGNRACYEPADADSVMWVIHSKQVA